jgi:hypothetical protein
VWESPLCAESLETPDEGGSGQIQYNVQVYCTCYTTGVKADPSLTALRHSISLNVERSGEVDSST